MQNPKTPTQGTRVSMEARRPPLAAPMGLVGPTRSRLCPLAWQALQPYDNVYSLVPVVGIGTPLLFSPWVLALSA